MKFLCVFVAIFMSCPFSLLCLFLASFAQAADGDFMEVIRPFLSYSYLVPSVAHAGSLSAVSFSD